MGVTKNHSRVARRVFIPGTLLVSRLNVPACTVHDFNTKSITGFLYVKIYTERGLTKVGEIKYGDTLLVLEAIQQPATETVGQNVFVVLNSRDHRINVVDSSMKFRVVWEPSQ